MNVNGTPRIRCVAMIITLFVCKILRDMLFLFTLLATNEQALWFSVHVVTGDTMDHPL